MAGCNTTQIPTSEFVLQIVAIHEINAYQNHELNKIRL